MARPPSRETSSAQFPQPSQGGVSAPLTVNGKPRPYLDQLFWAGLASLCYLPATAAPIGLTRAGLPVGLQIIGAEGDDLTTIEFARLAAAEIGGFTPPPSCA